jgi:hypothetical protein
MSIQKPQAPPRRSGGRAVMDHLTLLRAHDGKRMAKRFTIASNNRVHVTTYDLATWFSAEAVPLAGIRDIAELLRRLEGQRDACVIRGELLPETDLSRTRRKKSEKKAPSRKHRAIG